VEDKFRTLSTLGLFISGMGWAALVFGVIAGILVMKANMMFGFLVIIAGVLLSLVTVAQGQMIQCFVAIERNTRPATGTHLQNVGRGNLANFTDTRAVSLEQEQAQAKYDPQAPMEQVLQSWKLRPDTPLTTNDKDVLRELSKTLRRNLSVDEWLEIVRLYRKNPSADFGKYR
jgi:hypothetical protein